MFCYFLNCRKFLSKSAKLCYILTVASPDGEVSEFFLNEDTYDSLVGNYGAFDCINLGISVSRGRVSIISVEHALDPLSMEGGNQDD